MQSVDGRALLELVEQVARRGRAALERRYSVAVPEPSGEPRPVVREALGRRVELAIAAVLGRMERAGGDRGRLPGGRHRPNRARKRVRALKAFVIARSAAESWAGSIPIWRANDVPS